MDKVVCGHQEINLGVVCFAAVGHCVKVQDDSQSKINCKKREPAMF